MLLEFYFIQLVLLSITGLVFINITPHALVFLGVLFICVIGVLLASFGLTVFAYLLISAEIHVFYVLVCLVLTWIPYETIKIGTLFSSNLLRGSTIIGFILLTAAVPSLILSSNNLLAYNDVSTASLFATSGVLYLNTLSSGVVTNMILSLASLNTTVVSFEFILINVLMLIAVFVYYFIIQVNLSNKIYSALYGKRRLFNLLAGKVRMLRSSEQGVQLVRGAVVSFFSS